MQAHTLLKRFQRKLREDGVLSAFNAGVGYIQNSRTKVQFEQWYRYGRHYDAPLNPHQVYWISPKQIHARNEKVIDKSERYMSHVIDGDWDQERRSFEDRTLYQSMERHFHQGIDWKETELYERTIEDGEYWRGITTEAEFEERCAFLDKLYETIRHEGYKTQRQLLGYKPRRPTEIKVQVGRDGKFFYLNGKHRLSIARILDLDRIPVNIIVRHAEWQDIRDTVATADSTTELEAHTRECLNHPDIENLVESL